MAEQSRETRQGEIGQEQHLAETFGGALPPRRIFSVGTQAVRLLIEGQDTGGAASLLEMHHPPHSGPPLHLHEREDEAFYVLEGRYRFTIGDAEIELERGGFAVAKKGIAHRFVSLGPELGKMLVHFSPAGVEAYFERMGAIEMTDPERGRKCSELDTEFGIRIIRAAP